MEINSVTLLDHFRPPLGLRRHWHAFHNSWATYISSDLNRRLPEGYFAEANAQFGIEIDVAAFEEAGAAALIDQGWNVPAPTQTLPLVIVTDIAEVLIFQQEGGPILAGAIELVSPANKDRPAHRGAFVAKCAAILQQGIGLVVVDVVTDQRANLHDELLQQLESPGLVPIDSDLYATSYRPVSRDERTCLDVWQEPLALGEGLPTLPLWLRGNLCLPVDLASTYERTCREQRIIANGV